MTTDAPQSLSGKSVLVTGGSRGIGAAIVRAFGQAGARVAFTYRSSAEEAKQLESEVRACGAEVISFCGNAAEPAAAQEAVDGVIAKWASIDVLVNNAGVTRDGLMLKLGESDWDTVIDMNLKGVFNFCKAVYRPMMKQRSGRIINMSSVVGVNGNAGQTNYAASKAGIIGLSKSLAKELGSRGVTVNVVAPGVVETDMTDKLSDAARQFLIDDALLKRIGMPSEVAAAVLFLASDAAAYITGHVLCVDGGLSL
jgi:3-oxoacyl-[acyl-carrier protein] reductase